MKELINVTTNEQGSKVVDARELWTALEVGREFSKWINKHLIESPYFVENEDYVVFAKNGDNSRRGRPSIEYAITLDTAKKLSMTVNTDRGNEVRNYFLECEKKVNQMTTPSYMIDDPIQRAKTWIKEAEEKKKLEQKIEEDKDKVSFAEQIEVSDNSILIGQFAKIDGRYGQNKLFSILRNKGVLMDTGNRKNEPYQQFMDRGYFEVKETAQEVNGTVYTRRTTMLTGKGQTWLKKCLDKTC